MAGVDEFKRNYLRLCSDHHIEPQESVLSQLKSAQYSPRKGTGTLNLTGSSLTIKTCAVLGKVLSTDATFTQLRFSDCMIAEDGIKLLVQGLSSNTKCKKLDFKGNNIRGAGAEAVGRMLRQNTCLYSLCLEWNCVGLMDNAFAVLCEGLGSNSCLQILDLRNNQISHQGAAELAAALKRNPHLKALDLRWNNIGIIGGRSLLNALQYNRTLHKLDLAGNNIPHDILNSIAVAVDHNADRQTLTNEYTARSTMLTREIQEVRKEQTTQVADLLDRLDKQEDLMRKSGRSTTHKIGQLQEALEERKSAFNSLAAKLSMRESELSLNESKVSDLGSLLSKAHEEKQAMLQQHQEQFSRDRQEHTSQEARLIRELNDLKDRNVQLESKVDEFERKCKVQQNELYELKEQLAHTQADSTLKAAHYEERLQQEKSKSKEAIREADVVKQKEMVRVQQEADSVERSLKERAQKLELVRCELEDEISRLKAAALQDRLQAEETLIFTKQKIKTEEESRCKQLEERVKMLQQSKDDTQAHCSQQLINITELQTKNSNLVLEQEALRRTMDNLNQELSGKNNEKLAEVGKVQLQVQEMLSKVEQEKQNQEELRMKVSRLEKQLSDQSSKFREQLSDKDNEISSVHERLRMRESEISRMREEDVQRTNMLQSAIMTYCNRSPLSPR